MTLLFAIFIMPIIESSGNINVNIMLECPDTIIFNTSSPGERTMRYNGTIDLDADDISLKRPLYHVSLAASAGGWEWNIHPRTFILKERLTSANFTFTLKAPDTFPAGTVNNIHLRGEITSLPGLKSHSFRSKYISASVEPMKKYNISLRDGNEANMQAGNIKSLDILIKNQGNIPMDFEFQVVERDNITVFFSELETLEIKPFGHGIKTIHISYYLPVEGEFIPIIVDICTSATPIWPTQVDSDYYNEGNNVTIPVQVNVYRELQENELTINPNTNPLGDIIIDEGKGIAIIQTMRIGGGNLFLEIFLLLTSILVFLVYWTYIK